jgi:hypothetical protein
MKLFAVLTIKQAEIGIYSLHEGKVLKSHRIVTHLSHICHTIKTHFRHIA